MRSSDRLLRLADRYARKGDAWARAGLVHNARWFYRASEGFAVAAMVAWDAEQRGRVLPGT